MKPAALSRRGTVVVALALAAALTGFLVWSHRQPRYEGRSAGYWVGQLLRDQPKARRALRAIGPAAVPALAATLKRRSWFWSQLEAWRAQMPRVIARRLPSRAMDELLQARAIDVLHEFGAAAAPAVPALLTVDPSFEDAFGLGSAGLAQATLTQIGPAGIPYFIRALSSPNPRIRWKAATYLGHLGREAGAATLALARTLNDSNSGVRNTAVVALAEIGPQARAAVPSLHKALQRKDDSFRLPVIQALWRITRDSEDTVPILVTILTNQSNPNRAGAAIVLGEMGPAAKSAVPALTRVLGEEFSYTRVKSEEALRQINRGSDGVGGN